MEGICLRILVDESRKKKGMPLYEWILEKALKGGIRGGSAFRAIAGYGRHSSLREEHFFELAKALPVEILFIINQKEFDYLFALFKEEKIDLFYSTSPVDFCFFKPE